MFRLVFADLQPIVSECNCLKWKLHDSFMHSFCNVYSTTRAIDLVPEHQPCSNVDKILIVQYDKRRNTKYYTSNCPESIF